MHVTSAGRYQVHQCAAGGEHLPHKGSPPHRWQKLRHQAQRKTLQQTQFPKLYVSAHHPQL